MRLNAGLAELSEAIAAEVSRAAPMLAAIRIAPERHLTGVGWPPNLVITADLPPLDSYAVVLPGNVAVSGFVLRRDPGLNLSALQVPGTTICAEIKPAEPPCVGALALVVGANPDATPTVRLTAVHSLATDGPLGTVLDLPAELLCGGSLVLDGDGAMLGLCVAGVDGAPRVIPHAAIARLLDQVPVGEMAEPERRRGWIGAALQPVSVPARLRAAARQTTGRLVLAVVRSGPAAQAGVARGDILLGLDGESLGGTGTLRSLLGPERIGRAVELRLARHGRITTRRVVVAAQPA